MAICKYYYWESMNRDIRDYVRSCVLCSKFKPTNVKYGLLSPREHKGDLFSDVSLDFTHIFSSKHCSQCLVICDTFSNLCILKACKSTSTKEIIQGLITFFQKFGVCRRLFVDAASTSKSKELKAFLDALGIELVVAPSHAHFSAGRVESQVKRVVSALRFLINNKKNRKRMWTKYIPLVEFYINNTPQIATKLSANEIVYGQQLNTPFLIKTILPQYTTVQQRLNWLAHIRREAMKDRKIATQAYKERYDKNRKNISFQKNDNVFVWFERKASTQNPLKLQKRYRLGTIARKISDVTYVVKFRRPNGTIWKRLTHVAHMKKHFPRPKHLNERDDKILNVTISKVEIPFLQSRWQDGNCDQTPYLPYSILSNDGVLSSVSNTSKEAVYSRCESCYHEKMWASYID